MDVADEVPTQQYAFGSVLIGSADKLGRRWCRVYLVPVDRDAEIAEVERVEDDPYAGTAKKMFEATIDDQGHMRIERCAGQTPDSPHMWFVLVDDSRDTGRNTRSLVGFASDRFPDGTIIDEMEFVLLPVANEDQVAAIQWLRTNGSVEQVYVEPSQRRSDIGRRMTQMAGVFHRACGWPGKIHASSRRTELGEALVRGGLPHVRILPHEELSPPMDPPTQV